MVLWVIFLQLVPVVALSIRMILEVILRTCNVGEMSGLLAKVVLNLVKSENLNCVVKSTN